MCVGADFGCALLDHLRRLRVQHTAARLPHPVDREGDDCGARPQLSARHPPPHRHQPPPHPRRLSQSQEDWQPPLLETPEVRPFLVFIFCFC